MYTFCGGKLYEWASTNTTGNITADDRNTKVVSDRVDSTFTYLRTISKRLLFNIATQELICIASEQAVIASSMYIQSYSCP